MIIKTLGVFFTDNFGWKHDIKHVQKNLNKVNGLMNRHRNFLPTQTKISL